MEEEERVCDHSLERDIERADDLWPSGTTARDRSVRDRADEHRVAADADQTIAL